jgi:hypothetical protein
MIMSVTPRKTNPDWKEAAELAILQRERWKQIAEAFHNWPHREHKPSCSQSEHPDHLCDCGWAKLEQRFNQLNK